MVAPLIVVVCAGHAQQKMPEKADTIKERETRGKQKLGQKKEGEREQGRGEEIDRRRSSHSDTL